MNEINNEYSWAVQEWWNTNGSYNRLQFLSNDSINLESFCEIVEQWLSKITKTSNSRLDIRCFISDNFEISYILDKYKDSDMTVKTIDWKDFITFWINIGERKLSEEEVNGIKDFVNDKVDDILRKTEEWGWFENYAISTLNRLLDRWFTFERESFWVDEVFDLWWYNFGWSRYEISSFIEWNIWNDKMFWLRNSEWILISLVMIWDDSESTEWSVLEEYQSTWTIEPLLIATNWILIDNWDADNVYAHMRWNRSIWPWLKSWLRINKNDWINNILINLVEVEWNMEHFLEWTLDTSLFTEQLLEEIRKFTT
jgi:hypothetical protein